MASRRYVYYTDLRIPVYLCTCSFVPIRFVVRDVFAVARLIKCCYTQNDWLNGLNCQLAEDIDASAPDATEISHVLYSSSCECCCRLYSVSTKKNKANYEYVSA